MIISCPKCSRRFGVQDDLIPASGRRARCASCGEVFIARPTAARDDDAPIHYEILPNPGDGPATSSSFVAPAAPPAVLAQRRGSGIPVPGLEPGGPPVIFGNSAGQAAPDRTVALSPETVSAIRRSIASPPLAPVKEPGTPRWIARNELGHPVPCDRRELVRMIRTGLLLPGDRLKEEGTGREALASEIQDLAYYFALRSSVPARPAPPAGASVREPADRVAGTDVPVAAPVPAVPDGRGSSPEPALAVPGDEAANEAARTAPAGFGTGLLLVAVAAIAPAAFWILPSGPTPALPFGIGAATGGCLASAVWVVLSARRRGRPGMQDPGSRAGS